jgi:lysosomal acid lipase/cholesteryl ester hydrolase
MMGLGEFLPSNWFIDWLASITCAEGYIQGICESVMFLLCGFDEAQVNYTLLETIVHHTPAGSSTR